MDEHCYDVTFFLFFLGCDVTSEPSEKAQHHSLHH